MREFTHQIKDFNGLRKTSRTKRGVCCCSAVTNLVGRNKKLVTPENLTAVEDFLCAWPFGQFFVFKDCLYCFNGGSLVKLLPAYEVVIPSLEVGLRWTGLVLNDFALFSNGVTKVVYDPSIASFAITQNPWHGLAGTMEIFSGQVFVGGIDLSVLTDIESRLRISDVHYHAFAPHEYPLDHASNAIVWGAAAAAYATTGLLFAGGIAGFFVDLSPLVACGEDAFRNLASPGNDLTELTACQFNDAMEGTLAKIETNEYGTLLITTAGAVYVTGYGRCLGMSPRIWYDEAFYKNSLLSNISDAAFSLYNDSALLLDSTGQLWASGTNDYGTQGDSSRTYPFYNSSLNTFQTIPDTTKYKAIAIGEMASYAIREDGILCTCGQVGIPQVGRGEYNLSLPYTYYDTFAPIDGPNADVKFTAVSAFPDFALFLSEDGEVYFCGWNFFGEAGQGLDYYDLEYVMQVAKVPGLSDIVKVVAGYYCCGALDSTGNLYTWGMSNG